MIQRQQVPFKMLCLLMYRKLFMFIWNAAENKPNRIKILKLGDQYDGRTVISHFQLGLILNGTRK